MPQRARAGHSSEPDNDSGESDNDGAISSNLSFWDGIKFYIMQRVPQRDHLKQLVSSKKGILVQLEKQADIIIADNLRQKYAPAGALSWKYITDCVDQGRRLGRKAYEINPSTQQNAAPKGSAPRGPHRMPYTEADDKALREYVATEALHGELARGNKIYQNFEKINKRHPWQSWRNRWISKFSNDADNFQALAARTPRRVASEAPRREAEPARRAAPPPPPPLRARETIPQATAPKRDSRTPLPVPKSRTKPKAPAPFTKEDDKILWDNYENIETAERRGFTGFWVRFAQKYPHHDGDLWKDYYSAVWKPFCLPKFSQRNSVQSSPAPQSSRPRQAAKVTPKSARKPRVQKSPSPVADIVDISDEEPEEPILQPREASPTAAASQVEEDDGVLMETDQASIQSQNGIQTEDDDEEPLETDQASVQAQNGIISDSEDQKTEEPVEEQRTGNQPLDQGEKVFLEKLRKFHAHYNKEPPGDGVGFRLDGHYVRWAKLQEAVFLYDGFDNVCDKNLWLEVARNISPANRADRHAYDLKQLEEIYEEYLVDFDEFTAQEQEVLRKLGEVESQQDASMNAPERSGIKRSQQQFEQSSSFRSSQMSTIKRRRLDSRVEIPSTPEHKLQPQPQIVDPRSGSIHHNKHEQGSDVEMYGNPSDNDRGIHVEDAEESVDAENGMTASEHESQDDSDLPTNRWAGSSPSPPERAMASLRASDMLPPSAQDDGLRGVENEDDEEEILVETRSNNEVRPDQMSDAAEDDDETFD